MVTNPSALPPSLQFLLYFICKFYHLKNEEFFDYRIWEVAYNLKTAFVAEI